MRVKFTTSLDSELVEKIKIRAITEKTDVSKILEKLIIEYLREGNDESRLHPHS